MFGITSRKRLAFIEKKVAICYKSIELMEYILIKKGIITKKEIEELSELRGITDNLKSSGMKFFTKKLL